MAAQSPRRYSALAPNIALTLSVNMAIAAIRTLQGA